VYTCGCVFLHIQSPLRECRSIRSGASGLPYYCAPLVCISVVIELLAVWRHNKPKPTKPKLPARILATPTTNPKKNQNTVGKERKKERIDPFVDGQIVISPQDSASPGPVPSLISSPASPPSDDAQGQVCQSPFDEEKMLLCTYSTVTPVRVCTVSSPPSPPSLLGYENVPCAPFLSPHPRVHYDTFASPPPS